MPEFDLDRALLVGQQLPEIDACFGFCLSTGSGDYLHENLRERGYDDGEIAAYLSSDLLLEDTMIIERNGMELLRRNFTVSDQGHSDDELVGSCWVELGTEAWKKMRDWADYDESFSTGSGSIGALFADGPNIVYRDVSEMGCACLELEIRFYDLTDVKTWIAIEDGVEPMPPEYLD